MCKIVVQLEEKGPVNEKSYLDALKRAARNAPNALTRSGVSVQVPKGKKKIKKNLTFRNLVEGYGSFRSCVSIFRHGQELTFRVNTAKSGEKFALFIKGIVESLGWEILIFHP